MRFAAAFFSLVVGTGFCKGAPAVEVRIPQGVYHPAFKDNGEEDTTVGPLMVDQTPVTNRQFLEFIKAHPEYSKSKIKPLFADEGYLSHWPKAASFGKQGADWPVIRVSWFAARRYCEARGKRLPTIAEWEFFSDAADPENESEILKWYAKPHTTLKDVDKSSANKFGLKAIHGEIWEWVDDFSQVMMSADSRDTSSKSSFFCGGAALKVKDPRRYATFLRFAFRSSLTARYTSKNLGFRCVRSVKGELP